MWYGETWETRNVSHSPEKNKSINFKPKITLIGLNCGDKGLNADNELIETSTLRSNWNSHRSIISHWHVPKACDSWSSSITKTGMFDALFPLFNRQGHFSPRAHIHTTFDVVFLDTIRGGDNNFIISHNITRFDLVAIIYLTQFRKLCNHSGNFFLTPVENLRVWVVGWCRYEWTNSTFYLLGLSDAVDTVECFVNWF